MYIKTNADNISIDVVVDLWYPQPFPEAHVLALLLLTGNSIEHAELTRGFIHILFSDEHVTFTLKMERETAYVQNLRGKDEATLKDMVSQVI